MVERALNLFWIALGLGALAGSIGIGLWEPRGPASGFLPFVAALIITGGGVVLLLSRRDEDRATQLVWPARTVALRMLVIIAGLIGIGLAMPYVGFVVAALPIMVALMLAIERQGIVTLLVVSTLSTVGIYSIFTRLLGTKLPASGFLGL